MGPIKDVKKVLERVSDACSIFNILYSNIGIMILKCILKKKTIFEFLKFNNIIS